MLPHLLAALLAFVLLVGSPAAARELASVFVSVEDGAEYPTYELYSAACSESERVECVIARLVCGEYNGLSFVMGGFSDQEMGSWFTMNGATAILKSKQNALLMRPVEMQMDDLDGNWVVTFLPSAGWGYGDGKEWLRPAKCWQRISHQNLLIDRPEASAIVCWLAGTLCRQFI